MPYTMEDFQREVREEAFKDITSKELIRLLSFLPDKTRKDQLIKEFLKTVPTDKLLQHMLSQLSPQEIEEHLRKSKDKSADANQ